MDEQYMQCALEEAQEAQSLGDLPFGAVIVFGREIVGKGKCENNTTGDVTCHAEMNALRVACAQLKRNTLSDCVMYCTNEPCVMCAAALFQAKIARVVIALTRDDVPSLRRRSIRIFELAKDSGYEVAIDTGVLKNEVLLLHDTRN